MPRSSITVDMRVGELRALLKKSGCVEVRRLGAHLVVRYQSRLTVIPIHSGQSISDSTLLAIERHLELSLGVGLPK